MLLKVSLSSMRKMMKDYIVLLAGLVISISIFYMFQVLAQNKQFILGNSLISSIVFVFNVGSVLLAVITFFYILYANSFLLSLRRKEFGMYMMLGAKKSKITSLMFIETLAVGVLSIVVGIAVGAGLAQGVGVLLMKQIDFSSADYHALYMPAVIITVLFFIAIFLLTSIFNAIKLARTTILGLIRADEQHDRIRKQGFFTIVLAVVSLVCLAIGYFALNNMGKLREIGLLLAAGATTLGTYLFFMTFLPVFVRSLKRSPGINDKGLNSFTLAQLRFRTNSLTKILATVTMLIALGVGAIAGGMAFQNDSAILVNSQQVYDVAIHDPDKQDEAAVAAMKVIEQQEYRYKVTDKGAYYLKDDLLNHPPLIMKSSGKMSRDYKQVRVSALLPEALYTNIHNDADKTLQMPQDWAQALYTELGTNYPIFDTSTFYIADQKQYQAIQAKEHKVVIAQVDDFLQYKTELKAIDERQLAKFGKTSKTEALRTKYSTYQGIHTMSSGTMFMGFFLGIAFLAMMASCLMFKILSGASKDTQRYQMLRKIGVRREMLSRSIYKEFFVVFVFPGIIGLAHVLVGMEMFSFILLNPYYKIWVPTVIFMIVYTIYYVVTVQLYKGIVLPKENK